MQARVVVKLSVEGLHRWKDCPFEEVGFLRHHHRHVFMITAEKEVSHDDREVEIILLKRSMTDWLEEKYGKVCLFGDMSCEMIARTLIEEFGLASCEVLEDGENGAKLIKS